MDTLPVSSEIARPPPEAAAPALRSREAILEMVRRSAARGRPYGWLNYQPIDLPGYEETLALRGRDCFDRASAIFAHLSAALPGPRALADWGCNLGFFSFEAARRGHRVRGYDCDRRLVDACAFLAATSALPERPAFCRERLSAAALRAAPPAEVVLCFSVLHHLEEKERLEALAALAEQCEAAYVELDGPDHGRLALELFFWRVEEVVETNDRYGSGRRRRKTWFCTNREGGAAHRSLKARDLVPGRGVFLRQRPDGTRTVLKRERGDARRGSHTWLATGLAHEGEMYRRHPSPFFPRLLAAGEGEARWLELEHLPAEGPVTAAAIGALYDFLERERLFLVDFRKDCFIPGAGGLRMVDLESLFEVEGSVAGTIARRLRSPGRLPAHLAALGSWRAQRAALEKALVRP